MLQNPVFRLFLGAAIGFIISSGVCQLVRWQHAKAVRRRWRGAAVLLLPLLLIGATGCTSPTDIFADLKDDHAAVSLTVVTPWGTQKISRINPATNQSASITPDGVISITAK